MKVKLAFEVIKYEWNTICSVAVCLVVIAAVLWMIVNSNYLLRRSRPLRPGMDEKMPVSGVMFFPKDSNIKR